MYSLSKSIDFYWLMISTSNVQRAPHPVQHQEFDRVAAHFDIDPDRTSTAARDTRYLASLCLLASVALTGAAIEQHTDFWMQLIEGFWAIVTFSICLRLYRGAWRLKNRQMGGWLEVMLPASWAFRMRDPNGRGPNEMEA